MPQVILPDVPESAHELEDYVAALFQAAGYFVETDITEKDFTEILQLDVVATSYDTPEPTVCLAEAKSGKWSFRDLFKLLGWMTYLKAPLGGFFVSEKSDKGDPAKISQKFGPHKIHLVSFGDFTDASERFREAGFRNVSNPSLLPLWRFSYRAKRRLVKRLSEFEKSQPDRSGPSKALEYHRLINDRIFFVKDPQEQLCELYDAYKDHPRLSLGVCVEMKGDQYDAQTPSRQNSYLEEALYIGKHDLVQACFFVEHRARLAVLKAAIDYTCSSRRDSNSERMFRSLPDSFHDALEQLHKKPNFRRYALFWQVFLWGFGGFYLEDRKDIEFGWLSECTGIPPEEIPSALNAYDLLFPVTRKSWITSLRSTHCMVTKMMPWPFLGIGAIHRKFRYGVEDYTALGYTDYTTREIASWNNNLGMLLGGQDGDR